MLMKRLCGLIILAGLTICGIPNLAMAEMNWAVTVYGGRLTDGDLDNTVTFRADFEDAYFIALAVSRRVHSIDDWLDFEIEAQAVKHFDDQDHLEFNGLGVLRWQKFPWDHIVDTGIAGGLGLSYATETPDIEAKNHKDTNQLLAYLMFETAFSLPHMPNWSVLARIHHRSGAFKLFNDVTGASNALGLGIRYRF